MSRTTVKAVVVTAVAAGVLYVAASTFLFQNDDEDRPPIIVKNGSMTVEVDGAHPWKKDLIGRQWKPEHSRGRKVESFDVSFTDAQGCTATSGTEVSITYIEADSKVARVFMFTRKRLHGLGKREPKFESPVDLVPTNPSTLTYQVDGRITSVVVSGGSGSQTCAMPAQGNPTVSVKPQG